MNKTCSQQFFYSKYFVALQESALEHEVFWLDPQHLNNNEICKKLSNYFN